MIAESHIASLRAALMPSCRPSEPFVRPARGRRGIHLAAIASIALALAACGGTQSADTTFLGHYVTQVTLHPDIDVDNRLYSVNYQRRGLLPVCTEVDVVRSDSSSFDFVANGQTYHYEFYSRLVMPREAHFQQVFGDTCPDMADLTDQERAAIGRGEVEVGMSRRAVLLAIGYPPDHATFSLDTDVWRYWDTRWTTFEVVFEGDTVVRIVD